MDELLKRLNDAEAIVRRCQAWAGVGAGPHPIITAVLLAAAQQRDPIPDSDLDDEQPISLNVRLTLGDIRRARRAVSP